jgi:hypothetical protein
MSRSTGSQAKYCVLVGRCQQWDGGKIRNLQTMGFGGDRKLDGRLICTGREGSVLVRVSEQPGYSVAALTTSLTRRFL